ncbi:hypothetical protein ACMDCR_28090 [Labrys okinawensis]|uniref:hypothetical protein n=1 Tax=Labrys okinawensis TaxID=346911 RepID=UPI0039BC4767
MTDASQARNFQTADVGSFVPASMIIAPIFQSLEPPPTLARFTGKAQGNRGLVPGSGSDRPEKNQYEKGLL